VLGIQDGYGMEDPQDTRREVQRQGLYENPKWRVSAIGLRVEEEVQH
jgi:hypothetical protein